MGVLAAVIGFIAEVGGYARTARERWNCHRTGAHRQWENLLRRDQWTVQCLLCGRRWDKRG